MLRDRYQPVDLFALAPQLGLEFEPQLAQLDRLLDDDQIFARVRDDLGHRYPLTRVHGRNSTPVEVILRMLVVMRLYSWSYAGGAVLQLAQRPGAHTQGAVVLSQSDRAGDEAD